MVFFFNESGHIGHRSNHCSGRVTEKTKELPSDGEVVVLGLFGVVIGGTFKVLVAEEVGGGATFAVKIEVGFPISFGIDLNSHLCPDKNGFSEKVSVCMFVTVLRRGSVCGFVLVRARICVCV